MSPRWRILAFGIALAVVISPLANLLWRDRSDGVTLDLLHLVSPWLPESGANRIPEDQALIVAIDEETYRQPPFDRTPQVAWTPQIATVLNALLDAGVKVVGIDTIFNQSLEYVDDLVPASPDAAAVFANYDRDLLRALAKGGRQGRIVMSYAMQGGKTIEPTAAQIAAVGGPTNLRPTNMMIDADGVIRRGLLHTQFSGNPTETQPITSLPLEIFARAGDHKVAFAADGRPLIDGAPLRQTAADSLLINFRPVQQDPPIFSFADLYRCAQQGRLDYFQQHFAGRIVILGTVLDIEDRHLTSKHLVTNPMGRNYAPRCALPVMPGIASAHASAFIPGTYVLATIVDNLQHGNWLQPASDLARLAGLFVISLMTCLAITYGRAIQAISGLIALLVFWGATVLAVFQLNTVLPLIAGLVALAISLVLSLAYRVILIDGVRRQLRRSFSLYLPSAELDRLAAQQQAPTLGGELRPVTILFSDIAGYSSLSEELAPADLVSDLNRYFSRMTEIVQQHGGFVDKFIGDGILAVFGAPLAHTDHAASAVAAALQMVTLCQDDPALTIKGQRFGIRVGVHSGDAIVGNIGSPNRFNYTVVGDSVNLASRLEGVGKRYHTSIIVSEQTRQQAGDQFVFREIDLVRVVGRDHPVRLFTPLSPVAMTSYDEQRWMSALSAWRSGDFKLVSEICEELASRGDKIAGSFATRARHLLLAPPITWDGIVNLSEK